MLSTDFARVKKDIDPRTEYLIFGFVHDAQRLLSSDTSYFNITDLITFVIAAFYFIKNEWDEKLTSAYYKIEDDCLTVCKKDYEWNHVNAYLKGVIDKGSHSWKFKVENKEKDTNKWFDLAIGVVDDTYDLIHDVINDQDTWFCGSDSEKGGYIKYGKRLEKDDIIEMIIDIDNKSLKYIINDADYGKAHDLKENTTYRPIIYMYCIGNALRIIS